MFTCIAILRVICITCTSNIALQWEDICLASIPQMCHSLMHITSSYRSIRIMHHQCCPLFILLIVWFSPLHFAFSFVLHFLMICTHISFVPSCNSYCIAHSASFAFPFGFTTQSYSSLTYSVEDRKHAPPLPKVYDDLLEYHAQDFPYEYIENEIQVVSKEIKDLMSQ